MSFHSDWKSNVTTLNKQVEVCLFPRVYSGDSGGPLLRRATTGSWVVVGVTAHTTFGQGQITQTDEAMNGFANVSMVMPWITQTLEEAKDPVQCKRLSEDDKSSPSVSAPSTPSPTSPSGSPVRPDPAPGPPFSPGSPESPGPSGQAGCCPSAVEVRPDAVASSPLLL